MWSEYISAISKQQVLECLHQYGERARIIAGATDLLLELERGIRKGVDILVDISRIPGLAEITFEKNTIHIGPMVTHNHCVSSKLINDLAFPLAQACWEVGSPQIRNRGTVVGNLVTGSPANDTITPLMALKAVLTLESIRGKRVIPIQDFFIGVRKTVLQPDEMVVDISFPAMKGDYRGIFQKFALRESQAISVVNTTVILKMNGQIIEDAMITLGAVAPTIVKAVEASEYLKGKIMNEEIINTASDLAVLSAKPISDIRGSAHYRQRIVKVLIRRSLHSLIDHKNPHQLPDAPVLLWGNSFPDSSKLSEQLHHGKTETIETQINGKKYSFKNANEKTLLHLLREDAGLIGSKEGCAEGECGACTVFLDGVAVMSCLVPAPRAHGADIVTVEGLAPGESLDPVQSAFIDLGAVQCGYCTPGFIMSARKLLDEKAAPNRSEIMQAISGNLCRCTGYYKIIEAIEHAANNGGD